MKPRHYSRGFTLMEVLVALAVLALGLTAVMGTSGSSIHTAVILRNETFAHWVAMNELATLQIAPQWPEPGDIQGDSDMAGQTWYWSVTVKTTPDPGLRRIEIRVYRSGERNNTLTELTGFMGKPMPTTSPTVPPALNNQAKKSNNGGGGE